MRGTLLASVLLLVACDGGCGSDGEAAPRPDDVRPPSGLTWEASIGGGREALVELRSFLPAQVRVVAPESPGTVLERLVPELPIAGAVADDADVHALRLRIGPMEPIVAAARASIEDDALGPDLPLIDGAPHGGRWVRAAPAPDAPGAMVLGDVLVVTPHSAALERAAPWLAWGLAPRDAPDGVVMRLPESASLELRRDADAALEEWAEDALGSIRAERARHDGPPPFGDPEELVRAVRTLLTEWIAYLPDVTAVVAHARAEASGLVVDLDARVREGSPLARALEGAGTVSTASLLALPSDTALAWTRSTRRADGPSFARQTVERLGGDRLDDAAKAQIAAIDRLLAEGAPIVAAGAGTSGPWLAAAISRPVEPDPFRDALGAAFIRDVGGALLGCEGPLAPSPWEPTEDDARTSRLCTGERPPSLRAASVEGASAVAITRGEATVASDTATRLAGRERAGGLGDEPDAVRTIDALGRDAIAAGYASPSRALGAASLLAVLPEAGDAPGRTAPLAWSLSRTDDGLRLRVAATATALEDALSLLAPFFGVD